MIMNFSSNLFAIVLLPFGILKIEVRIALSQKKNNGYDLVLYGAGEISVFSTLFGLKKLGRLGIGSRKDSRIIDSGYGCNQRI